MTYRPCQPAEPEGRFSNRKPTIAEALALRLGRTPTHRELCDEVTRILGEGTRERTEAGKLRHQRKR